MTTSKSPVIDSTADTITANSTNHKEKVASKVSSPVIGKSPTSPIKTAMSPLADNEKPSSPTKDRHERLLSPKKDESTAEPKSPLKAKKEKQLKEEVAMEKKRPKSPLKESKTEIATTTTDTDNDDVDDEKNGKRSACPPKSPVKSEKKTKTTYEPENKKEKENNEDEQEDVGLSYFEAVELTGSRKRKSVDRLEIASLSTGSFSKKTGGNVILDGPGEKLGDIPSIFEGINKKKSSDSGMVNLFGVIFGRATKKHLKQDLRSFCGFQEDMSEKDKDNVFTRMNRLTLSQLKEVLHVLHLEVSGTKEKLTGRLFEFLSHPRGEHTKRVAKRTSLTPKRKSSIKGKKKSTTSKKSSDSSPSKKTRKLTKEMIDDLTSEDENVDDGTSEDEDYSEEKQSSKKQKTATSSSPAKHTASKNGKKTKTISSETVESDGDEQQDEEEEVSSGVSEEALEKQIVKILEEGNIEELSNKKVRKQLETYFKVDLTDQKDFIKQTIDKHL